MRFTLSFGRAVSWALVLGCVVLSACGEPKVDLDNPKHYSGRGIAFDYPGNWEVTGDQDMGDGVYFITIESPGDAVVMVHRLPEAVAMDIRTFAEELAKKAQQEVPIGELSPSRFGKVQKLGLYEGMKEECVLSLLGERLPLLRTYYRRVDADVSWHITTQVAKEDVKTVRKGFQLVVRSLKLDSK